MDSFELRQRITRSMIRVSERTANIRKPEKFEYRKHMTSVFMDMLELCIEANRSRGNKRLELQNRMDTKLDVLRSLVDTAVSPEDRLISPGLHEVWSKELNEIGRMLGGWKKSNE
ncbi:diversity-generating retroelement protein Avd [Eisenbergiella sp.]